MIRRDQYEPDDILRAVKRRLWVVIVPFLLATIGTVLWTNSLPDRYESEIRIQRVNPGISEKVVTATVRASLEERLPTITAAVLTSSTLADVVTKSGLYPSERALNGSDPAERLRRDLRTRVVQSDSFVLSFSASNPTTAHDVAEQLGTLFVDTNRDQSEAVAAATTSFFSDELEKTRRQLVENEQKQAEFNRQYAGQLPSQLQSNAQLLQSAQLQLQAVRSALARDADERLALDQMIDTIQSGTTVDAPAAATPARPAEAPTAREQLDAAEQQLRELRARLRDTHPDVVRARRHVEDLQAQVAAVPGQAPLDAAPRFSPTQQARLAQLQASRDKLVRQMASRQTEESQLVKQIQEYTTRIDSTPERQAQLTALTRDYETLKDVYTKLLAKKEDVRLAANLQNSGDSNIAERFVIASPATLPSRPASPNRTQLNAVGAMAGLLLGLGLAALLEFRDTSMRDPEDITFALNLPVLATVPVMTAGTEQPWYGSMRAVSWFAIAGAIVAAVGMVWHFAR